MSSGIMKYCPWCDYRDFSLRAVHQHMDEEHAFLKGAAPPPDPRFTITQPEDGVFKI